MGFQIKKATSDAPADWYVPEWRGNRAQPDDEQIAVEMKPLSAAQLQSAKQRDFGGRAQKHIMKASQDHRNAVIMSNVITVEGVSNGDGVLVTNGKELVRAVSVAEDAGVDDLLSEIYDALIDRAKLDEGRRPS